METTATTRAPSTALQAHFEAVRALDLAGPGVQVRSIALEVAGIVNALEADDVVVCAALLQGLLDGGFLTREGAIKRFGAEPVRLARALSQLGRFGLPENWNPERELEPGQAEALRKMLLAVIGDVRLVVVRLAEQLQRMRSAKTADTATQRKIAVETREVYAPLANRLGVWQLKWELEDLAFRFLEPVPYRHIATALKARRSDRERYIGEVKDELEEALRDAGILAAVAGRPKHLYSIWKKMQSKRLAFEELMDIRAARVLVANVADCYAALGIVHALWPFIPGEFDDYIATPKDNLYRSIHTAVIGPGSQPVEIQIRTHDMHAAAERGVAAHWRYKEGRRGDLAYQRKIDELRSLLSPADGAEPAGEFLDRMRIDLFQDRIYALSPAGEIVDVPVGGTPLDFAYQIHTDLGHRTRGAKVNGRMVALDHALQNSDVVEIIASKTAQPSRDWLASTSGYLASPRHRNKVRAWFRKQDETQNRVAGRALLDREMQRLGIANVPMVQLLGELKLSDANALHAALGLGEISIAQIAGAIQRLTAVREPESSHLIKPRGTLDRAPENEVRGIGDLLSTYARCCKPVPPEAIVGYITVGRGVSIHSRSCGNLARLSMKAPQRVLAVDWGAAGDAEYPVELEIQAFDRRGLVRDVSAALADEKISIRGMNSRTDRRDNVADIRIQVLITGLPQLSRVLSRIVRLPNIISAKRG